MLQRFIQNKNVPYLHTVDIHKNRRWISFSFIFLFNSTTKYLFDSNRWYSRRHSLAQKTCPFCAVTAISTCLCLCNRFKWNLNEEYTPYNAHIYVCLVVYKDLYHVPPYVHKTFSCRCVGIRKGENKKDSFTFEMLSFFCSFSASLLHPQRKEI